MKKSPIVEKTRVPNRNSIWVLVAIFLILDFLLWKAITPPSVNLTLKPAEEALVQRPPLSPPIRVKDALPKRASFLLERCVEDAISQGNCAGAVVLVARKGRLLYHAAFGYAQFIPQKRPMGPDTLFDMASLTKPLATATSILLLLEQGKLSLADKAAKLLPGFKGDAAQEIRLRDLLTHTSGLTDDALHDSSFLQFVKKHFVHLPGSWAYGLLHGFFKTPDVVAEALGSRPATKPGTTYLYADINFILLGEIVHRVSGQPLNQFFEQNVARRLGLRDTGFLPPASKRGRIAATEKIKDTVLVGVVHDPRARELAGVAGHAGLFSTARETWMMAQTILDDGKRGGAKTATEGGEDPHRLMSAATAELMTTVQSPAGLPPRGLGWEMDAQGFGPRGDLFPKEGFGHTGYTGTSVWADKKSGTIVVILTNRVHPVDKGDVSTLRRRVANVVASEVYRSHFLAQGKEKWVQSILAGNFKKHTRRIQGGSR